MVGGETRLLCRMFGVQVYKRAKESVIFSICYKLLYDEQISSQFKLDNSMSKLMHIYKCLNLKMKKENTLLENCHFPPPFR